MTYKIEKQIESYLNGNYPFALMINGKWGSGKTYYLSKVLFENYKNYKSEGKVVYISCNGVKEIDELKRQILFHKWNFKKGLNKNSYFNGATNLLSSMAQNYGVDLNDLATLGNDDLLVIDDLERRNPNLSVQDIFGFVSTTFTEQNEIKVILVSDEEELLKGFLDGEKENYTRKKEKTIYRTIDFDEDLSKLFRSLIESKVNSEFNSFLKEKSEFVLSRCKIYNEGNLRTIGFYLNSLEILYKEFGDEIKKDSENIILNTLLLLSILYKKGIQFFDQNTKELKSSYKPKSGIERLELIKWEINKTQVLNSGQTTDQEYSKFNEYLVLSKNLYDYFPSLFELVDKGVLANEQFQIEFNEFVKYYDKDLPWVSVFQQFKEHENFLDNEFDECLNNISKHIVADKYSVNELHYIAYLYEQYQNNGIIGVFDASIFYTNIVESMKNRIDTSLDRDFFFDDSNIKRFSEKFNNITKLVKGFRKQLITEDGKSKIPVYLQEYLENGEFNEQNFIRFLNIASEEDIVIFSKYVLKSYKHIDTFCNLLIKTIITIYIHETDSDQNIELLRKCLLENIQNTRIPKFRIEPLLENIQKPKFQ